MDIYQLKLNSLNQLYKFKLVLLLVILIISIYLLDRGILTLLGRVSPLGQQQQVEIQGLDFSYITLSILWPLILASVTALFNVVGTRARLAYKEFNKTANISNIFIPWYFEEKSLSKKYRNLIFSMPIFVSFTHCIPLIITFSEAIKEVVRKHAHIDASYLSEIFIGSLFLVIIPTAFRWQFKLRKELISDDV